MLTRPAFRYYGGKWILAPWIIEYFPPHYHYIELCGGAGSVLIRKPPSVLETFNDLDGDIVNFFRILRDRKDEIIERLRLTPYSRTEYKSHAESASDPVERARRFFVGCMQSIGSMPYTSSGWRVTKSKNSAPGKPGAKLSVDHLFWIARRFSEVQIEQLPCLEMIERYNYEDNLFYFDPPYARETRSTPKHYCIDWVDQDHIDCAKVLREAVAYVVISGYACNLYCDLYERHGWKRFDKEVIVNSGGSRTESVWLSPLTYEIFSKEKMQVSMF